MQVDMKFYKPTLYTADECGTPVLFARRCECGHICFPPQDYGCEKCGAPGAALRPRKLAGRGVLRSWATVHMHAKPYPKAPFVVGKIRLEDGPVVRALLKVDDESGLRIGMPVKAIWVPVRGDATEDVVDLWFEPALN